MTSSSLEVSPWCGDVFTGGGEPLGEDLPDQHTTADEGLDLDDEQTALITGGSAGLGRALVAALSAEGWQVVTDGRDAARLEQPSDSSPGADRITAVAGDVTDPITATHLAEVVAAGLDLLVNNASMLGPAAATPVTGAGADHAR